MTCVAFAPHPHLLSVGREKETSRSARVLPDPGGRRAASTDALFSATHLPARGETVRKRGRHTRTRRYEC